MTNESSDLDFTAEGDPSTNASDEEYFDNGSDGDVVHSELEREEEEQDEMNVESESELMGFESGSAEEEEDANEDEEHDALECPLHG